MREREAFFKEACQKKDEEHQDLAYVQVQGIDECRILREENSQLKDELAARDRFIDSLQAQLEEREQAIATLTTENQKLEGYLAEAAKNEIFLNEELERFKYGIQPGGDGDTPANPTSPQNTQDLKILIKGWKRQAKNTRDWTKANQLISELENLL